MNNKIAWLIERTGLPLGPVYLTVAVNEWKFEWTPDHDAALQYTTKEEAESAWAAASRGRRYPQGHDRVRITEHEWCDRPPGQEILGEQDRIL